MPKNAKNQGSWNTKKSFADSGLNVLSHTARFPKISKTRKKLLKLNTIFFEKGIP